MLFVSVATLASVKSLAGVAVVNLSTSAVPSFTIDFAFKIGRLFAALIYRIATFPNSKYSFNQFPDVSNSFFLGYFQSKVMFGVNCPFKFPSCPSFETVISSSVGPKVLVLLLYKFKVFLTGSLDTPKAPQSTLYNIPLLAFPLTIFTVTSSSVKLIT